MLHPLVAAATCVAASGLLALCSLSAHAELLASNVRIDWITPVRSTIFRSATKNVGPAVEVTCPGAYGTGDTPAFCQQIGGGPFSIDIGESSITLTSSANFWSAFSYNGFQFTFATGTPRVIGASLNTNNPSATSARIDFTEQSVSFDLQGLDPVGEPTHFYALNIQFAAPPVPVPIDSPTLLLIGGFVLLIAAKFNPSHGTTSASWPP